MCCKHGCVWLILLICTKDEWVLLLFISILIILIINMLNYFEIGNSYLYYDTVKPNAFLLFMLSNILQIG